MSMISLAIAALVLSVVPPDINSDGIPESLLLPGRFSLTNRYSLRVESGQGTTIRTFSPASPGGVFGWRAAWVGDADADAWSDVCVTEPLTPTSEGLGRAFIYSSSSGALLSVLHAAHSGQFGLETQATDDLGGDGVADTLV